MGHTRIIKPGFFSNDLLAEVHPLGRLLFIGLWTIADREGRLEDRPRRIKALVFPYEESDADGFLNDLTAKGFILRYRKDSGAYIQVVNWHKHQRPHPKEARSSLPVPDEPGPRLPKTEQPQPRTSSKSPRPTRPGRSKEGPRLVQDQPQLPAGTDPRRTHSVPGSAQENQATGAKGHLEPTQVHSGPPPGVAQGASDTDQVQARDVPGYDLGEPLVPPSLDSGSAHESPSRTPEATLESPTHAPELSQGLPSFTPGPPAPLGQEYPGNGQNTPNPSPCNTKDVSGDDPDHAHDIPFPSESSLSSVSSEPSMPSVSSESRAAQRPAKAALCKTLRKSGSAAADSDIQTNAHTKDSELTPLAEIARKAKGRFTPSETSGYIMAHFPMQQLGPSQRPLKGDTGLTTDQVSCLVRHGCTVDMARTALAHFRQKQVPNKPGAWAFHCLKEELPQDSRIALREETRTAQRAFKENQAAKANESSKKSQSKGPPLSPDQSPPAEETSQEAGALGTVE